jgi:hypothetical protein
MLRLIHRMSKCLYTMDLDGRTLRQSGQAMSDTRNNEEKSVWIAIEREMLHVLSWHFAWRKPFKVWFGFVYANPISDDCSFLSILCRLIVGNSAPNMFDAGPVTITLRQTEA